MVLGYYQVVRRRKRFVYVVMAFIGIAFIAFQLAPEPVRARLLMGRGDEYIAERTSKRFDFTRNQQFQAVEFVKDYPLFGVGLNRTYHESGFELGAP